MIRKKMRHVRHGTLHLGTQDLWLYVLCIYVILLNLFFYRSPHYTGFRQLTRVTIALVPRRT